MVGRRRGGRRDRDGAAPSRRAGHALLRARRCSRRALGERTIPQLRKRKVDYRPGMPVTRIEHGPVVIAGAARQAFDLVILATGAAPLPWLKSCGPGDRRARLRPGAPDAAEPFAPRGLRRSAIARRCAIRRTRSPASTRCATASCWPRTCGGCSAPSRLQPYVPQKRALLLLTCGARYAIAQRGGWTAQGRCAMVAEGPHRPALGRELQVRSPHPWRRNHESIHLWHCSRARSAHRAWRVPRASGKHDRALGRGRRHRQHLPAVRARCCRSISARRW